MLYRALPALLVCLILPAAAATAAPQFSAPTKLDTREGTEPRVTILGNDHRFVVTTTSDRATVFRSTDQGCDPRPPHARRGPPRAAQGTLIPAFGRAMKRPAITPMTMKRTMAARMTTAV